MLGVKKDQKVWFESLRVHRRGCVLTVDKVGRRWITFVEDPSIHADRDADEVYEKQAARAYRLGKIWVSEDACKEAKKLFAQWVNFCKTLGSAYYRLPRGMTIERIAEARKALGMEQDLKKTEREIFDEVK